MIHRLSNIRSNSASPLTLAAIGALGVSACAIDAQDDDTVTVSSVQQALEANATYTFRNVHNQKCLDVTNFGSENGANIQLWECTGQTAQQFTLVPQDNGYVSLRNVNSGKCVDVWERSSQAGANIAQYTCNGGANQQFDIEDVGGGNVRLIARHSGMALDAWNWGSANGTNVAQWHPTGGTNQSFVATRLGSTPPDPDPDPDPGSNCTLPSSFQWSSTGPLIAPQSPPGRDFVSIKDPTIVQHDGLYHVFATVFDASRGAWSGVYLNFADWSQAGSAPQFHMGDTPAGGTVAPQVFYFEPHQRWYLIYQWGAKYSTNTDISNPNGWTTPRPLGPTFGIDYWVICDDVNCHLFFSDDNGDLYRSTTSIGNFPNFGSNYVTVMSDTQANLFEASNVYKIDGSDDYLLLVEAWDFTGARYFRSWTSDRLDGSWAPLADSYTDPFAGRLNVSFEGSPWTTDISHGELIRSGSNQRMTIDPCNLQYLYQGRSPNSGGEYPLLPYRLGLLTEQN